MNLKFVILALCSIACLSAIACNDKTAANDSQSENTITGISFNPNNTALATLKSNNTTDYTTTTGTNETTVGKPDHRAWDALLRKYVSEAGKVNYSGFKSDKTKLQAYLEELASNPVQSDWSRSEKMAYWINVYNAYTIKLILDHYPVSSITNLHDGKPWDVKSIKLGNKTYSLDQVENDILRPHFKDARIHFAVNCAARSCPPLLNRAWTAENLNRYLEQQTRAFINNPKYNTLNTKKIEVSKIFDWYAADFGDLTDFLNKYARIKINDQAEITYRKYDWSLNN